MSVRQTLAPLGYSACLDSLDFDAFGGGIGAILSVSDGALVPQDDLRAAEWTISARPYRKDAPPQPGDLAYCLSVLPVAFEFVSNRVAVWEVLVHCRHGRDRTRLFWRTTASSISVFHQMRL